MSEKKKVILAYSGGLDTSIIIPWLKENYDFEVIAVAGDVGQGEELAPLKEKAIKTGASKIYIEDLRDEFVKDFIFPTIKAQAVYEGKYLLGTSFARPVIAKRLVEIARAEGCDAICHGCTGKGNDQVRFELTIKAFAPDMPRPGASGTSRPARRKSSTLTRAASRCRSRRIAPIRWIATSGTSPTRAATWRTRPTSRRATCRSSACIRRMRRTRRSM